MNARTNEVDVTCANISNTDWPGADTPDALIWYRPCKRRTRDNCRCSKLADTYSVKMGVLGVDTPREEKAETHAQKAGARRVIETEQIKIAQPNSVQRDTLGAVTSRAKVILQMADIIRLREDEYRQITYKTGPITF